MKQTYKNFTFEFQPLKTPSFKKYKVVIVNDMFPQEKRTLTFGDNRYQHYKDKIGFYSSLDHKDKKRRENYYKRHGAAKEPKTIEDFTPKWFSHKYLW